MFSFRVKSIVHDYEVQFIDNVRESLIQEAKDEDIIIIDRKVKDIYSSTFRNILENNRHISIDATEKQKSYQELTPIIQGLIDIGFKKNHRLIAIGGGITQDVTAFTASIIYRGVDWLFYPTTLLAQGDSCIGSKTSINFGIYKNQVGGFYPPNKILTYPAFINTLSEAELKSGLGEMCHYFIVAGEPDFKRFKKEYDIALSNKEILLGIIARSLEIKKRYVEIDEFDRNERQVFNYGHSFGHAIESLTDYKIPHGIAVAYGMDMANFVSLKLGYIPNKIRIEIRELLQKIWKGFFINDISIEKFIIALSKDKKNVGTELRLILNKGYGNFFKTAVKIDDTFITWIREYFSNVVK